MIRPHLVGLALLGLLTTSPPTAAAAAAPVVGRSSASTLSSMVVAACPLPTLSQGATGAAVVQLQLLVHVPADGSFGPITHAAVLASQRSHGLGATGVVDAATWRALGATCSTATATTRSRLDSRIRAVLATHPSTVSVAVYDGRTGASYTYGGTATYDTASIVKVEVLGTLLRAAAGAHRSLSTGEKSLASRMIRYSDNAATTQLWNQVGGGSAV